MHLDWSETAQLDEDMVVFRALPAELKPRVTIAMPTFNRAGTIRRALQAIARQSYRDFVLVLSDNAGRDPHTLGVIEEFAPDLPGVIVVGQPVNIGALRNLHYLLTITRTEYFMWLADDDEITETYLEDLVALLDASPTSPAAAGLWQRMSDPSSGALKIQSRHRSPHLFVRAIKYASGPREDTLFYGLHRTAALRRCRFGDYLPPNRGVLTNWCYVFLFDQVLQGPICYSDGCRWISHNYSVKQYNAAGASGFRDRLRTLLRRINVYGLYVAKATRRHPALFPPVLVAALFGVLRDVLAAALRLSLRRIKARRSSGTA